MVRELADYESALDKVEATEQSLRETLCFAGTGQQSSGYAKILLIRLPLSDKPAAVAGMALYFYNYSSWRGKPGIFLEDLFVRPQYRKRGYGKMLLKELAREVLRLGGGRLDWNCLKWNQPSLDFYGDLGATKTQDRVQFRVDGDALENLAVS
jgi:GNAT superfamily N-acetyltransferase